MDTNGSTKTSDSDNISDRDDARGHHGVDGIKPDPKKRSSSSSPRRP